MEIQSELTSTSSFQKLLESQKDLFQDQVTQLEKIVDKQCDLTGVNPLSQEMAAGAFLIKIGKRPRDLLNPKAIDYMQSVFSLKDAISKKECREISALFGVTVTQVREFFAGQRSRVRKFVKLSTIRSNGGNEVQGEPPCADPNIPMDTVPLNSMCPTSSEGPSSLFAPGEILPGTDDSEKLFLENIFSSMRKEETFSGQVELMEKILQIQNSSVLYWFLNKGGVMILATWLSQAAVEEQTSVLHVILKVLCHLPLHKALPVHMSAILQSVNKLRFYRRSDISNRARILLSRWSKIFARSQAIRKANARKTSSDAQDEMLLKQSIGEIMEDELRESKADIADVTCTTLDETLENTRKFESPQPLKLLTDATDDPNKKLIRGLPSSQIRERRKVQLVEQPGQRTAGRNTLVARSVQATQGRPLSADDIQKAKMRAHFMQSKYGKAVSSSDDSPHIKTEGPKARSSILVSPSKPYRPRSEEQKPDVKLLSKVYNHQKTTITKKSLDPEEPSLKKWKGVQIQWKIPPAIKMSEAWSVGNGQNSKEVEIQKNRIRREKEIIYRMIHDIPLNPKEPWDCEMDYDDTLTPEIPTEQLPDIDALETPVSPHENEEMAVPSTNTTSTSTNNGDNNMAEPDLELLAVLLKNPQLVFALTSGQGGSLSSEETVRLLDMIKTNGGSLSGIGGKTEETVEVSLPSPTPSSDPPTVSNGWRQETVKNPFSRQNAKESYENMPGRVTVSATVSSQENLVTSTVPTPQFLQTASKHIPEKRVPPIPQTSPTHTPERRTPPIITSLHQRVQINSPNTLTPALNIPVNTNNFSQSNSSLPGLLSAAPPSIRDQTIRSANMVNAPMRPASAYHSPPLLPTSTRTQQPQPPQHHHLPPHNIPEPQLPSHSWTARPNHNSLALKARDHQQANQNGYNPFVGGPTQARNAGPPQNGFMDDPGFESWSPDNSPTRTPGYMPGRSYVEPRVNMNMNMNINMNMGGSYNHSQERWRQGSSHGYRDHGRIGYPRGRERRR